MTGYQPYQINSDEWIITTADGEHFTGGPNVYASREECEKAIRQLQAVSPAVIQAAMDVIASWSGGDLARAVRKLDGAVKAAWSPP